MKTGNSFYWLDYLPSTVILIRCSTIKYDTRVKSATLNLSRLSLYLLGEQVDRLEDELVGEQEKFKAITEELEQTFAEMSGY
jgi:hypothetical protein